MKVVGVFIFVRRFTSALLLTVACDQPRAKHANRLAPQPPAVLWW
jgi:hypothetical protein